MASASTRIRCAASNALWHTHGRGDPNASRADIEFANTQHTQTMEERDPFRAATFDEYHKNPEFATPAEKHVPDGMTHVSAVALSGAQMGNVDRSDRLHRMPGLHRSPARRKTTSRWWAKNKWPWAGT